MSPPRMFTIEYPSGFPRVSGDEPERLDDATERLVFSPRERG